MFENQHYPYHREAEIAVLCGVMRYDSIRTPIFSMLEPSDFWFEKNQIVFAALKDIDSKGIPYTPLAVEDYAKKNEQRVGRFEEDSCGEFFAYLADIYSHAVLGAAASWYAEKVKDLSIKRNLMDTLHECYEQAREISIESSVTLDKLSSALSNISYIQEDAILSHKDASSGIVDRILSGEGVESIKTGLDALDALTGGFRPKQLIIIGARPGVGKSMFGLTVADNMAKAGKFVYFVTIEMTVEEMAERQISFVSRVPLSNLRDDPKNLSESGKERIKLGVEKLHNYSGEVMFDEMGKTCPSRIRANCKQLKKMGKLDCVVVDYLQLVNPDIKANSTVEAVSTVVYDLKSIAKELNVPVIALAQLNREVAKREDSRPVLTDLRESGAIEQAADVAVMIHRDLNVEEVPRIMDTELIVRKNRSGRTGTVRVYCETGLVHFVNKDKREE